MTNSALADEIKRVLSRIVKPEQIVSQCPNNGYHGGCHYPICGPDCAGRREIPKTSG